MEEKEELENKIINIIKDNNIKVNENDLFQFKLNSKNELLKELIEYINKKENEEKEIKKKEIIEKCGAFLEWNSKRNKRRF